MTFFFWKELLCFFEQENKKMISDTMIVSKGPDELFMMLLLFVL